MECINHSNLEGNDCFVRVHHPITSSYEDSPPAYTISRGRLFSKYPLSSPTSCLISADFPITYISVCQKLFILLLNRINKTTTIYNSVYVMLCYVISYYYSYLLSYLKNSFYLNFMTYHTVCYVI